MATKTRSATRKVAKKKRAKKSATKLKGKRFVNVDDVDTLVFDWGTIKWISEPKVTNAERFTTGLVNLDIGKGHNRHNHPGVEEIIYCMEGQGLQTVGREKKTIRAGDMVHVPPGVYHSTKNTGWDQMKLLVVYSPSGPEEIIRNMPECRVVKAGKPPVRK